MNKVGNGQNSFVSADIPDIVILFGIDLYFVRYRAVCRNVAQIDLCLEILEFELFDYLRGSDDRHVHYLLIVKCSRLSGRNVCECNVLRRDSE